MKLLGKTGPEAQQAASGFTEFLLEGRTNLDMAMKGLGGFGDEFF